MTHKRMSPVAVVLLPGCVLLLAGGLLHLGGHAQRPVFRDLFVAVTQCSSTGTSPATAEVLYTVSNRGTAARAALLRIEYRDAAGVRVGTDVTRVGPIAAGATVVSGKSTVLRSPARTLRCRVRAVE